MLHRFVLCLLLVLLPVRSLLAAGHLTCEPPAAPATQQHAGHGHAHGHHAQQGQPHDAGHGTAAKPCKVCAPCCLTAAPPPVLALETAPVAPAARVALAPAERWDGIVPPLPDPPPRA